MPDFDRAQRNNAGQFASTFQSSMPWRTQEGHIRCPQQMGRTRCMQARHPGGIRASLDEDQAGPLADCQALMQQGATMRIQFLGGTGTVTGSKYLLEHAGRRVLVDCGLFGV